MIDRGKVSVLGVDVDAVDYEAAVERIIAAAVEGRPAAVSALAVHGVMTGVDDEEHLARLNSFDLVTCDGQPVRWAMRLLHGVKLPDRVYGPKLTNLVCERAAKDGIPVFFYGSTPETLEHLERRLGVSMPDLQIAGMRPSRFKKVTPDELDTIAEEIQASGAKICFVGLGCPRQEVFAYENAPRLSMPTLAVGAAFDYHAGLQSEPPEWMQNYGLQWLYRLGQDPRRLWRRYIILNPRFVVGVACQRKRSSGTPVAPALPPVEPTHIGWA